MQEKFPQVCYIRMATETIRSEATRPRGKNETGAEIISFSDHDWVVASICLSSSFSISLILQYFPAHQSSRAPWSYSK